MKKLVIFAVILIFMSISTASAIEINDTIQSANNFNQSIDNLSSPDVEMPESPDLIDVNNAYVYPSTVDNYFKNGVLDSKYKNKNLIFSGEFKNIGMLEIACDNVSITGLNSNLKNTVFKLTGNQLTLKNLNFNQDNSIEKNDGATILVGGNNIDLVNLTINYVVPKDVKAYAIHADGYNYGALKHLRILNSSIYFEGHNDYENEYNCAVKLTDVYNAVLENNTIHTSLPLKNIEYELNAANLNSAYVYSVGMECCDGLVFNNNTIIADANKRTPVVYPTLDGIWISKSDNVVISNNSIYMTDYVTSPGIENYLYGINVRNLKNLLIVNNSISMITTGGKLSHGTAYPIQIAGPAEGVTIEYNDLYSFSNGPNIGIYSQCADGQTHVTIRYNKINVTGLAGSDEWALVTGIESQDNFAEIFNNQIEVHSISDVGENDNIYAISYRQSIYGPNTFDIENNIAITDGYYAVYILNSEYSSIINNTLISFNDNVKNGDDAYRQGSRHHINEDNYDNKVIRAIDYYSQRNAVDNTNIIDIDKSSSSDINTNTFLPKTGNDNVINNPVSPRFSDFSANNPENNGYVDDGLTHATISDVNGQTQPNSGQSDTNQHSSSQNGEIYTYGDDGKADTSNIDGNNLAISNSSSSSLIGLSNNPISGSQSSTSASSSQSVSKAYEIEEMKNEDKFIPSVFLIIIALFLLIVGYKRKREDI